jgi:hypothetical protein
MKHVYRKRELYATFCLPKNEGTGNEDCGHVGRQDFGMSSTSSRSESALCIGHTKEFSGASTISGEIESWNVGAVDGHVIPRLTLCRLPANFTCTAHLSIHFHFATTDISASTGEMYTLLLSYKVSWSRKGPTQLLVRRVIIGKTFLVLDSSAEISTADFPF